MWYSFLIVNGGEGPVTVHINSVLLFERVRPRSQSESKPPGSSAAESAVRRPLWFVFSILTCSSWQRNRAHFTHWETIGVAWVGNGVWCDAAGPLAAGGAKLTPAGAAPPVGFGGDCCEGLVARAVAAGTTRVATEGAERR